MEYRHPMEPMLVILVASTVCTLVERCRSRETQFAIRRMPIEWEAGSETLIPARASRNPNVIPAGPPPAIQQQTCSLSAEGDVASVLDPSQS
jgi:hypothetical protein